MKLWSQFVRKVLAFSARALVLFPSASFLSPDSIFNLVDVAVPTAKVLRQTEVSPQTVKGLPVPRQLSPHAYHTIYQRRIDGRLHNSNDFMLP